MPSVLPARWQVADWIGIPWSIGVTAILTALAAILVALFYQAYPRENGGGGRGGLTRSKEIEMRRWGRRVGCGNEPAKEVRY